jgi:dynein heavy chain, axonemal
MKKIFKKCFITNLNLINIKLSRIQQFFSIFFRDFSRFYFLSDEELLEILADTKDPLKVQKHVNKCFEAINRLEFTAKAEVIGMNSQEKEYVKFNKSINVEEGDRKGNVEKWLLDIEKMMILTLTTLTDSSIKDSNTLRTDWV